MGLIPAGSCKNKHIFLILHYDTMKLFARKYQLTLLRVSHLSPVVNFRISAWRLWLSIGVLIIICISLGVALVLLTPVKRSVPGFMTADDRTQVLDALSHIDSLNMQLTTNQVFIDNLATVMDTGRNASDSTDLNVKPLSLPLDSLMSSSPAERTFMASMENADRFNLSVLAPMAADALVISHPAPGALVLSETLDSPRLRLILPKGTPLSSVADGTVIAHNFDNTTDTHSLTVQSKRGFVTHYSNIPQPLVEAGATLLSGQAMTVPGPVGKGTQTVCIEMWRDGLQLIPGKYIVKTLPTDVSADDIAAPRGK